MNPVFLAVAQWIAKSLGGGVLAYATQKAFPSIVGRFKVARATTHLESPEQLNELIKYGDVTVGDYVEGVAFFSLSTVSHLPMVPLTVQMNRAAEAMMNTLLTGRMPDINSSGYTLPTTQFPIVHDDYRVGFLYPHQMHEFTVPLARRAGESLPLEGRQICILRNADYSHLDNRLVKYRARVVSLTASDIQAAFPGISDDNCDNILANESLFLSAAEDRTFVEFYESSPHSVIIGSHFLETHWESQAVLADVAQFPNVLNDALVGAVQKHSHAQPLRHTLERVNNVNVWMAGRAITVTQPVGLPYFHLQLVAPLNDRPNKAMARQAFHDISGSVLRAIDGHYLIKEPTRDLNSIDDYSSPGYTILQSTAARTIKEPVLVAVRHWLERKQSAT